MPIDLIDEGDCLSRINKLPEVDGSTREHLVIFGFHDHPEHIGSPRGQQDEEDTDRPPKVKPLSDFYDNGFYTIAHRNSIEKELKSIDDNSYIRVVSFGKCSKKLAKDFVMAVLVDPATDPTACDKLGNFLESPNLRYVIPAEQDFIYGTSVRATGGSHPLLTFFVAMPYLDKRLPVPTEESGGCFSLDEFLLGRAETEKTKRRQRKSEETCSVYQAWFVVTNSKTMAVFKSLGNKKFQRSPLFQYQPRLCALSAMLQMLSNLFQPTEWELLQSFRKVIVQQTYDATSSDPTIKQSALDGLADSVTDLSGMVSVIDAQITVLRDLHDIFDNHQIPPTRPDRNAVKLPCLEGQVERQKATWELVVVLLRDRRQFSAELKTWLHELKKELSVATNTKDSQEGVRRTEKESEAAKERADKMQMELERQGQTISIFTLFTSTFLPLMFLTSYFGMTPADWKGTIHSQGQFWLFSGPITFLVILMMLIFLYVPDQVIRDFFGRHWESAKLLTKGKNNNLRLPEYELISPKP